MVILSYWGLVTFRGWAVKLQGGRKVNSEKKNTRWFKPWPFDPLFGGHDSPLKKGQVFTIAKRFQVRNPGPRKILDSDDWILESRISLFIESSVNTLEVQPNHHWFNGLVYEFHHFLQWVYHHPKGTTISKMAVDFQGIHQPAMDF